MRRRRRAYASDARLLVQHSLLSVYFRARSRFLSTRLIRLALPLASDHLYARRYLSKTKIAAISAIIEDIRGGLKTMFKGERWMAPATREYALTKLNKTRRVIGVSATAASVARLDRRYSRLHLTGSLVQMATQAALDAKRFETQKLLQPERATSVEEMRATEGNAMHIYEENLICKWAAIGSFTSGRLLSVVTAAMVESPFFDGKQRAAINYGALGFIIGEWRALRLLNLSFSHAHAARCLVKLKIEATSQISNTLVNRNSNFQSYFSVTNTRTATMAAAPTTTKTANTKIGGTRPQKSNSNSERSVLSINTVVKWSQM